MVKLTQQEFMDRSMALQRARKIFIETGLTNNISLAFLAYQIILAEQERQVFISTQIGGNRAATSMDKYNRPKCPDCSNDMLFRKVPDNPDGIKVQLVCANKDCNTVLNDIHDLVWWMENLGVKNES